MVDLQVYSKKDRLSMTMTDWMRQKTLGTSLYPPPTLPAPVSQRVQVHFFRRSKGANAGKLCQFIFAPHNCDPLGSAGSGRTFLWR